MKESLTKKAIWYHFIKTSNYILHLYSNFSAVTVDRLDTQYNLPSTRNRTQWKKASKVNYIS